MKRNPVLVKRCSSILVSHVKHSSLSAITMGVGTARVIPIVYSAENQVGRMVERLT